MAVPMTADQQIAQAKKWKLNYIEHSSPSTKGYGWRTHNRAGHGAWGPVNGVMIHHTGDDAPDYTDLSVIWNGRAGLPGPLAHVGNDDNGFIHYVGCGRANHAGGGDPRVLQQVVSEKFLGPGGLYPTAPHFHEGSAGATDGNIHFYGMECFYSGKRAMSHAQYVAAVLWAASICDFHKWSAHSVIGHKEWSDWKSDPASLDMKQFRADVALALKLGPGKWPVAVVVPPAPYTVVVGDTLSTIAAKNKITVTALASFNPNAPIVPGTKLRVK